ncbi:MAG: glycosyltransferase family 4 protein, partial [Alphaproteobacteria bacterium]|nr:glycosyltransferase family 4 protein [Alphaproteobacteria bacterium]
MPESVASTIRKELFPFEIELDQSGPILIAGTDSADATIRCKFRHFHRAAIKLSPGTSAGLAIGYRIYDAEFQEILFEHRASSELKVVAPERWVDCAILVPHALIRFDRPIGLMVDMLREDEYWFAPGPELANRFSIDFADAQPEQNGRLGEFADVSDDDFPARIELRESQAPLGRWTIPGAAGAPAAHLVFDVSDLVQYFHDNRLPTGIQRVQIEVITSILASGRDEFSKTIACFTPESSFWVPLDIDLFEDICRLALIGGDLADRNWRRALQHLKTSIERAPQFVFPRGAFLINLGSSWWLPNYFLNVRLAKAKYGIRYVPFVHDCIPIVTPEHCVEDLTRQFIDWALGAFEHADHVIVNSKATAADLLRIAGQLGKNFAPPAVVELNARFNAGRAAAPPADGQILFRNQLRAGEYVLFVATIESRKNHLLAFAAWIALLKKFGAHRVPKLVCVGKKGWLCDAIYARLEASGLLRQKVLMLSGISDPDLHRLYQDCLFTIYPSHYEGWGLPVTESLCSGKVPLLSRCSSLPEAGGDFGEYFELDSQAEFVGKLERLIFDAEYRGAKERKIAAEFQPRTWSEIGEQFLTLLRGWAETQAGDAKSRQWADRDLWPVEVTAGRYYPVRANRETEVWPGMASGEMFRQGDGWWWPERWGCWTKSKVARLAFVARFPRGSGAVLFLGIRGLERLDCTASITIEGIGTREVQLRPVEDKWLIFRADKNAVDRLRRDQYAGFEIQLSADRRVDFRDLTKGADTRIAAIGVLGFMLCEEGDVAGQLRFIGSA